MGYNRPNINMGGSPSTKLECDKKIAEKQKQISRNLTWASIGTTASQKKHVREQNAILKAEIAELRALKKTLPK